jgi:hypothetical protein
LDLVNFLHHHCPQSHHLIKKMERKKDSTFLFLREVEQLPLIKHNMLCSHSHNHNKSYCSQKQKKHPKSSPFLAFFAFAIIASNHMVSHCMHACQFCVVLRSFAENSKEMQRKAKKSGQQHDFVRQWNRLQFWHFQLTTAHLDDIMC